MARLYGRRSLRGAQPLWLAPALVLICYLLYRYQLDQITARVTQGYQTELDYLWAVHNGDWPRPPFPGLGYHHVGEHPANAAAANGAVPLFSLRHYPYPDAVSWCMGGQIDALMSHAVESLVAPAPAARCVPHMLRGNLNAASGADAARAADAAVARRDPSLKLPQPPARSTGAHGATGLNAAGYAPIVWGECTSATQPGCDLVWAFFATKCKSGGSDLANALEDAGIPLAALGLGDPWMGWGHRIRRIHDWLLTVPDETLVIMSDADDVFLLPGCSREEVVARYHDQDADVVWMSEKFIWPQESLMLDYPAVPPPPPGAANVSPFPFLNAGGAMGRARALRQMIWDIYQHDCYDDQLSYTQHFLRHVSPTFKAEAPLRGSRDANTEPGSHPNATDRVDPISGVAVPRRPMVVKLDYYNHLFLSTAGVSLGDIEPDTAAGRIRQRQTGGRACILHQNGNKLRSDLLTDLKKAFKTGRWPVPAPMAT